MVGSESVVHSAA